MSRNGAVVFCLALVVAIAAPACAEAPATTSCANPALPRAILDGDPAVHAPSELRTIRVRAHANTLQLAVVDHGKERELGLMCVTALRQDAGMIFVFPTSGSYAFWMKKTLVPLDMVWVDAEGRVTTVAANVPASTLDEADEKVARRSGVGRYVIELRAGDAARAGIVSGDRLALPPLNSTE